MGVFRDQFENDLTLRGLSPNTIKSYVYCVQNLVRYFRKPPDELSVQDIRDFQLYLTKERKVARATFNTHVHAIRSFYLNTLKKDWQIDFIHYQGDPRKIPEILNAQELWALFDSVTNPKHRSVLMTTYSAGLRVSETTHLRLSDIDSGRMMIRVDQGKGRKDRYVPLSKTLLPVLRQYWKLCRPAHWLFQNYVTQAGSPLDKLDAKLTALLPLSTS